MQPHARNFKKVLAAVSSLKRALGIPNHPTKQDEIFQLHSVVAYTPDPQSAALLGEIFNLYATGKLGRHMRGKPFNPDFLPRSVKVIGEAEGANCDYAMVGVTDPDIFVARMQQVIDQHIAPDKSPKR